MLYHIGTLFQNWLFLPLPSHHLNTLLNSIIICTNFYALIVHAFRVQSIFAMLFCTLCFRKKFHRKKKHSCKPLSSLFLTFQSSLASHQPKMLTFFWMQQYLVMTVIHWIQKHNLWVFRSIDFMQHYFFYPFFLSFFNCLQMCMLQISSSSKPAWSAALTTVL